MTHMRRMLFIEENEKDRLFFEGNNRLTRGKHYESFDRTQTKELYVKKSIL